MIGTTVSGQRRRSRATVFRAQRGLRADVGQRDDTRSNTSLAPKATLVMGLMLFRDRLPLPR